MIGWIIAISAAAIVLALYFTIQDRPRRALKRQTRKPPDA